MVVFLAVMANGNGWGWSSPTTIAGFIAAGLLLTGFLAWQRRAPSPILPLDLLTNRPFAQGLSLTVLIILGNVPVFILMPFYIQDVLGHPAVISGLIMSAAAVAFTTIGPTVGLLSDRFDWRIFVSASTLMIAAAMLALSFLGESTPLGVVVGMMVVLGIGVGLWYSPTTSAALSEVEQGRQGVASSATLIVRYTANVSTVAIAISIVTAVMASRGFEASLSAVTDAADAGAGGAFVDGMSLTFRIGAGINLFATVVTLAPFGRGRGRRREEAAVV